MVVDFLGTIAHRQTFDMIERLHVAGLRIDTTIRKKQSYATEEAGEEGKNPPNGDGLTNGICRDIEDRIHPPHVSPADYMDTLNQLRSAALERPLGIPLHITLDQEGNGNENYTLGNPRLFPAQMGLGAADDPYLVYEAMSVLGRQLFAAGMNWIHSPVVDVNTCSTNYEVATRAFSSDPIVVADLSSLLLRAFNEARIISTAKHFPGRGDSDSDSHYGLPVIDLRREELERTHIAPFKRLVKEGLPSIMIAHTLYPALDPEQPATTSARIVTDLLKKEMGFNGVVTTDNMLMGGIVEKYGVPEACVRAIKAGQDLLLVRSQSDLCDSVFDALKEAVRSGRISIDRLDDANRRILSLKERFGLFENGGIIPPESSDNPQRSAKSIVVERKIAAKAVTVRDNLGILPLERSNRILLIEGIHPTHLAFNNRECHPSLLAEIMQSIVPNLAAIEAESFCEQTFKRVETRIHEADLIVITNWVERRGRRDNSDFIRRIQSFGLPVIVLTNSPFSVGSPSDLPTVVNIFSANPASLREACKRIFSADRRNGGNDPNRVSTPATATAQFR